MKQRILSLDVARVLCVMWIVCFWHLNQYMDNDHIFFKSGTDSHRIFWYMTNGVLACFTFLSGFFISQKKIESSDDIKEFYKKRLLRFFIPLLLSCLLLIPVKYLSPLQVVTTCLGVSQFFPPPYPKTLWFFSMIIFFYWFTPLVLYLRTKNKRYSFTTLGCLYLFLIIGVLFLNFDIRLIEYYIFYIIPFLLKSPKSILNLFSIKSKINLLFFLIAIYLLFTLSQISGGWSIFICNILTCYIILFISSIIAQFTNVEKPFTLLSYSSMFAYLYHREVYVSSTLLIGKYTYIQAVLFSLLLFLLSYLGQRLYDYCLRKIKI